MVLRGAHGQERDRDVLISNVHLQIVAGNYFADWAWEIVGVDVVDVIEWEMVVEIVSRQMLKMTHRADEIALTLLRHDPQCILKCLE